MDIPGKRWQAPFAGTALRVLRTKGACHLFPKAVNLFLPLALVPCNRFFVVATAGLSSSAFRCSPCFVAPLDKPAVAPTDENHGRASLDEPI